MFPKIEKKILIVVIVGLVLLLIAGFLVYKYFTSITSNPENGSENGKVQMPEEGNKELTTPPQNSDQGVMKDVQVNQNSNQSGLSICAYKCGDGICQNTPEAKCDNLNCTCVESPQECPQDCK